MLPGQTNSPIWSGLTTMAGQPEQGHLGVLVELDFSGLPQSVVLYVDVPGVDGFEVQLIQPAVRHVSIGPAVGVVVNP